MGKATFVGGNLGMTAPITYIGDPVFANNDWATIIEACQQNRVHPTWEVGDQKSMVINGTDYVIDIIGKNHDTYSEGGTAPLTFQLHNVYTGGFPMNDSSASYWSTCVMRNTTLPNILSLMPSKVQSAIKSVSKLTNLAAYSPEIGTTEDKLFLLAEIEVFGYVTNSREGEGIQYEYYKAGNSTIKTMVTGSSGMIWWCRSPYYNGTNMFCIVNEQGSPKMNGQTSNYSISPAFCF